MKVVDPIINTTLFSISLNFFGLTQLSYEDWTKYLTHGHNTLPVRYITVTRNSIFQPEECVVTHTCQAGMPINTRLSLENPLILIEHYRTF